MAHKIIIKTHHKLGQRVNIDQELRRYITNGKPDYAYNVFNGVY